jgi:hypothetical protein
MCVVRGTRDRRRDFGRGGSRIQPVAGLKSLQRASYVPGEPASMATVPRSLVLSCAVAGQRMRRIRARRHHAEQWCGDLRSDQIESRNQWLARAAAASLPGATGYFMEEGPDGLGLLRQGAPVKGSDAWYEQRDAYIAQAFQHCDRGLPDILAATPRAPEIPLLTALSYWKDKLQCDPAAAYQPSVLDDPQAVAWLRHMGRGEPVPPFNGVEPDAN